MDSTAVSIPLDATTPYGFRDTLGYRAKQGLTYVDQDHLNDIFESHALPAEDSPESTKGIPVSELKASVKAFLAAVGKSCRLRDETYLGYVQNYVTFEEDVVQESEEEEEKAAEDEEDPEEKGEEEKEGKEENDNEKDDEDVKAAPSERRIDFDTFSALVCDVYAPAYVYSKEFSSAAARGDIETMTDLLERGCDPGYVDGRGLAPLHYAAEAGCLASVKFLLGEIERERVDAADHSGWTPLLVAASMPRPDSVKIMKELKSNGASASAVSVVGRNALHVACLKGNKENVSHILSSGEGASLKNAQDASGWTPLFCAVLNGDVAILEILIPKVDRAIKDNCDRDARHYCDEMTAAAFDKIARGKSSGKKKK